jgi:hypothetical protein
LVFVKFREPDFCSNIRPAQRTTTNTIVFPSVAEKARLRLETDAIDDLFAELKARGFAFRSGVIRGNGGAQALIEDPSGNVVELFQPASR